LGGLVVVAAFVFGVLPRFMSPAVVSHEPRSMPSPAATDDPTPAPPPPLPRTVAATPRPEPPAPTAEPGPPAGPEATKDGFGAIVSAGFAALDRGEFGEARDAFVRARALDPASASVADGLARAEAGLLDQTLAAHRQRAEAAEAREDWRAALDEYDAARKLVPAVSFAVQGRGRASSRATLDERLQGYLDRPERLAAETVTREAEAVLEQAAEAEPAGPRLRAQREALQRLLAGVRVPVPVRLVSDGITQVTIQRVGPLGVFKERVVELRPGSYVVVGARAGYRDARRTLVVPIGKAPSSLDVRCDEAL
jgi:hypothetical protein